MAQAGRKPQIFESVRVPLIGTHNTRQSTAGALVDKDQRFQNFFPVKLKNSITGKETYYLVKRPGFESFITPAAGNVGTAIHLFETVSGNQLISAFGATNSTVYIGAGNLGTITGFVRSFTEVDYTGTATVVMPSSNHEAWYYPFSGTLTKISDVDFPGNAGQSLIGDFVTMDGYLFIMDRTGRIWNSDLNSITAWTSTSFIGPTYYTGLGVGIARHHDSIVAFLSSSIEFFTNEGDSPSPLRRREMVVANIGAVATGGFGPTIHQHRDKIFFVGTSRAGGAGIYKIEKYAVDKISTQPVDQLIEVVEPSNVTLTSARIWGMDLLLANMGTLSFVYVIDYDIWVEMSSTTALWSKIAASAEADAKVYSLSVVSTAGKIYEWNTDTPVWQDNGVAYTATARTSLIDFDTEKRKRYHKIKLIGDKQASTTTVGVSWTDDDYGTYSSVRNVDMSQNRAYLTQCGQSRRRAFVFTNATNTPCRIEALELDYSICDS